MTKFARGLSAGLLVCAVALGVTPVMADTYIVAVGAASNSLQGQSAKRFADELQQRLGDKHKVEFYADGQLGDEKELMQKLRLGTVQFTLISSIMTGVAPQFGLFDLPFLVTDRAQVKAIDKEIVEPKLAPLAEAKGLHVISTWENGFRQITNNVRPINKPEDLAGLKIRTPSSKWRVAMFKQWGANPTPMAFSEVFVALQTGTMDGQENPLTNIVGANFQEVQKYLSITDHVYSPTFLTAGSENWKALPDDVKAAVTETAAEVQDWSLAEGDKADKDLIAKIEAAGVKVNTADKAAFVAASAPIYAAFDAEVPGASELVKQAQALSK